MSWTETTRQLYRRDHLRYASDTTDTEWLLLSFFLPARSRVGRPREVDLREVMNAILYIAATGCQWRALPKDFPPVSTVRYYFYLWREQRLWLRINLALVRRTRRRLGRNETPSAGVIDSQSVKTTESGGPRGFDAAKRVKGRKRHIVTDTQGFLLALFVHSANIRTVTGQCLCSNACGNGSRPCNASLPTASIVVRNCAQRSPGSDDGKSTS